MTRDLEETLAELGPGYREVVDRLTSVGRPSGVSAHVWLVAASLAVVLALGAVLLLDRSEAPQRVCRADAPAVYTVAYAGDETSLRAIVASQRADGSWSNDFITRQNAAALRGAQELSALVAYKRALRYLRSRGLEPLTDGELKARAARFCAIIPS